MNTLSDLRRKIISRLSTSDNFERVIFALILLAVTFNYFTQSSDPYKYFNSDELTIYVFINDLFHFDGHISAWHFSNAPSFFPDYVIGLTSYLLTTNIYWQIFLSSLIQIGLLYYVIRRLATPILGTHAAGYALLVFLTILLFASRDIAPYYQVLILNWHFGTYLVGLYYLLIYVDLVATKGLLNCRKSTQSALLSVIGLCLLSFLMTLSDALFAILFPGSLLLVGCYYLATRRISLGSYATMFALPFMASLLGHYTAPLVVPNSENRPLPIFSGDDLLPRFLQVYKLLYEIGIPSAIIILFFGWCLAQLVHRLWRHSNSENFDLPGNIWVFLALFVHSSLITSLVVVLASTALVDDRYLPSIFFAPFVFLFLLSTSIFQKTWVVRCAQLLLLVLCLQNSWSHRSFSLKADYYPEQIACIDNATRKLSNPSGIGEYWLTKKLMAFSKTGVRMVSVNPDLTPYEVLVSNDWYKNNYNFAVINTAELPNSMYLLDEKLIESLNGKPDEVAFCKDAKIILYKRGLNTSMDPERGSGVYPVQGCRLPHSTGTTNQINSCSLKSTSTSYAGNLSYGPYLKLPIGKYEFDLRYVSANPLERRIGHMDVSFLFPENHQVISEKDLMGSDGKIIHLKGLLEIDQNSKRGKLEIRTFVEANTDIEILSIDITRIEPSH